MSYFFFLYQSHSSLLCSTFGSISSDTDEVLSVNPSSNVFDFGDFNVHHKDWLTYSGVNDRPGEICHNFSISNDLTQMVNFPTRIPDCDCHSTAFLDFCLSSDASICTTMALPSLGNSGPVVVSVSIHFPVNSKRDTTFHRIAYDYSRADWDGLRDHLRDVPWRISLNLVLLLLLVNFVSGFSLELMYISLIISITSNLTHLHGFQQLVLLP